MLTTRMLLPVESRDRLTRPVDIAAAYARWLSGGIHSDDQFPGESILFESWEQQRRRPTSTNEVSQGRVQLGTSTGGTQIQRRLVVGVGGVDFSSRGRLRAPRSRVRTMDAAPIQWRENTPVGASGRRLGSGSGSGSRSGGRSNNSPLPSWYPRTPLADITAVVRANEIRRSRQREEQGHTQDSPVPPQAQEALSSSSIHPSSATLEHGPVFCTPASRIKTKPCHSSFGKVRNILLDVTNLPGYGDLGFLTPQRKLLNQIDTVQKVVMEELRRLEKTPTAKKAERQKRVGTLMSMR